MTPEFIILIIITVLLVAILIKLFTGNNLQTEVQRIEQSVKTEIAANRKETFEQSLLARKELSNSLESFEKKLQHLTATIDHKLTAFSESNTSNTKDTRTEIKQALDTFKKDLAQSIADFNSLQKDNFFALLNKQSEQNTATGNSLADMRQTLEKPPRSRVRAPA